MENRIRGLDGLRALSISLVLVDHVALTLFGVGSASAVYFQLGDFGVQIFFVISGFLITNILLSSKESSKQEALKSFYFRRAFRILPPVLAFLAVVVLLQRMRVISGTGKGELAAALFFFRNFTRGQYYTDHFWSLSVEEQFYLLWPLILFVRRGRPMLKVILPMALLGSLAVAGRALSIPEEFRINAVRYCAILTGCLLSVLLRGEEYKRLLCSPRLQSPRLFLGLALALSITLHYRWTGPTIYLVRGFAIALMVNFLVSSERQTSFLDSVFNARGMIYIGRISYSLYLWQQLFWGVVPLWFQKMPLGAILALLMAVVSYHGIELPMLRWRERIQQKWKSRGSPSRSDRNLAA